MYINWMEKVSLDGKENKNYTTAEIADLQKKAYYQGRADEEKKWKDKIKEIFDNYRESSLMENNTFLEFKKDLLEE